jgi:uncharacterized protein YprB with RNaseH-like and TPR domain
MINSLSLTKKELKDRNEFRCSHRHDGMDHPRCYEKDRKLLTAYFDCEATNLQADFGFMLSWAIKDREGTIYSDAITTEDIRTYQFDKRILLSLCERLKKYDLIYTFYGTPFDIPYARTRAMFFKLPFPIFGQLRTIDVYYSVRSKMRLHSNRLESACRFLEIEGKTHLSGPIWVRAMVGSKDDIKYVLDHNKQDVKILERLHNRLEPYFKGNKKSI